MQSKFRSDSRFLGIWSVVAFVCVVSIGLTSCGQSAAAPRVPITTVMQTIRGYSEGNRLPAPVVEHGGESNAAPSADDVYNLDGPYQAHIRSMFAQLDFAALEKEAQRARASHARVNGGPWKLLFFYEGVAEPSDKRSEAEWQTYFATIKKWIATYPDSATARIALGDAHINYAWAVRGNGYADSVSHSGWETFNNQVELGKVALLDAAKTKEKCPYWYEAMQKVALAQGWEKQQVRELFEQAAAFAPNYYHFYREYANFLLPKWYGEEGETQAFAEEAAKRVPEPDGYIIYFEIASLLACQCDKERDSLVGMSWPKVKRGYEELQRRYGNSKLKMNRFAYMSFVADDKATAQGAFAAVGDSWDETVWRNAANFQAAKKWALSQ